MPAPVPVLSNVIPVVNPHDLKFVMSKLDRDTLNELFASLGIAVQGSIEEVLHYCAFSGPWDYTKTKKLREFYTLSFDAHRLTGFLVEGPMNFPFERLFDLLDKTKRMNRRDSQNEDDLRGIIDVSPIDGVLTCRYKYTRERVKSDLSMFRDATVDTRFYVYDTGKRWMTNRSLYCVAIQPTTAGDYTMIREEFLTLLRSVPGGILRILSLKPKLNLPENCRCLSFPDCETTNQFMLDLLENAVLPNSIIRDVPSTRVFRWDSDLTLPSTSLIEESENIEEDLDLHLQDLRMEGVALHKTKTAIATLAGKKHAVSALGMVLNCSGYSYYTNLAFNLQYGKLDIQLEKVTETNFVGQEKKVYNTQVYWDSLWQFWSELVDRYIERTIQMPLS